MEGDKVNGELPQGDEGAAQLVPPTTYGQSFVMALSGLRSREPFQQLSS